jgi:hypothetical protein
MQLLYFLKKIYSYIQQAAVYKATSYFLELAFSGFHRQRWFDAGDLDHIIDIVSKKLAAGRRHG